MITNPNAALVNAVNFFNDTMRLARLREAAIRHAGHSFYQSPRP